MAEMQKAPAKKRAQSRNWPVLIAIVGCLVFIVGVWVNSYRVTHASAITATK